MKKSLLFSLALGLFSAQYASAYEIGEYIYTPSARYCVEQENSFAIGNFNNLSDWSVKTEDTQIGDFLEKQEDEELGMNKVVSINANAVNGFYGSWQCTSGASYVVSFQMKATSNITTTANTSATDGCCYVNLIANQEGTAVVDENTVSCGSALKLTTEWQTFSFSYDDENGFIASLVFYGLPIGVEIADVKVQVSKKVFDKRLGEKTIKYAKAIQSGADWASIDANIASDFEEMISLLENIEDDATPEDGESAINDLESFVTGVLSDNTEEYFSTVGADNTAADWYEWTDSYSVSSSGWLGAKGGWTFYGNRFGNRYADPVSGEVMKTKGRDIWSQMPGNYNYPISTATRDDKLAPGRYIMTLNALGYRMSGKGSSTGNYTAYPEDGAMKIQLFYEQDSLAVEDLQYNQYNRYVFAFTVPEEKEDQTSHYGFVTFRDNAEDGLGGNANYNTPRLYKISAGGPSLEQLAWFEKVQAQRKAFQDAYDKAESYVGDKNMPWMQDILADTMAVLKPYLDEVLAIEKETIYEDAANQTLENEIMNKGVRPMQYFNKDLLQKNLPFTDLAAAIKDANDTYADPLYAAYDIATYKTAIEGVESTFATIKARQTSEFNEADSLELRNQQNILAQAKETMKKSLEPVEIVNIDFSNEATLLDEGGYEIKGSKGSIVMDNFAIWESTDAEAWNTSKTWNQGYFNGTEKENPEVLRVGNGNGTVTIDDNDMPTRNTETMKADIVTITYDVWVGYLMNRSVGFELQDENNSKIGRFYIVTNTGAGDDDFSDETNKLYNVYKSVGSSKVSNSGIYTDASNKSTMEIILNYGDNTMKSTLTTSRGSVTTPAKPMLSENPIKKFILTSNYDNGDRRSWLDNIKISVTKNGAIITAANAISEVAAQSNAVVKSVVNGKVLIKTAKGTFNAAGAQVK